MVAAWALEEMGVPFTIIDRGPEWDLPRLARGCVYFHDRCNMPEEHVRRQQIATVLLPSRWKDEVAPTYYHRKIWGDRPYVKNSVEGMVAGKARWSTVWSMNDALRFLTKRYLYRIAFRDVTRHEVLVASGERRIISTIPFPLLEPDARCESSPLYIYQDTAAPTSLAGEPRFGGYGHVLYNVDQDVAWYRMSSMFGYVSMEFVKPVGGWRLTQNKKIITSPDADRFEEEHPNIMLTGRWGRWSRGVLGHETYYMVKQAFEPGGRWA